MPQRLLLSLCVFVLTSSSLSAQTLSIDHQPVGCAVAERFPRLEARFAPADTVANARVLFQPESSHDWYAVAMKPEGPSFSGVLPKPKKSLKAYRYYIEVTDKALGTNRTADYTTNVVASSSACKGKIMASALGSASVLLQVPAGAAALPAGFAATGVVAAGSVSATAATGAAAGSGGGLGTGALVGIVAGAGAAAAGVVVVAGKSGGEGSSATTGPSVSSPSPVAGRWVGMSPDGMVVEVNPRGQCPAEFDLELNLTGTSTTVTGTGTTRLRRTTPGQMCSDVLGGVFTYTLTNGRVDGGTISFDFGTTGNYRFSGTFTATRMSGTFTIIEFPESGRFAVNKQ